MGLFRSTDSLHRLSGRAIREVEESVLSMLPDASDSAIDQDVLALVALAFTRKELRALDSRSTTVIGIEQSRRPLQGVGSDCMKWPQPWPPYHCLTTCFERRKARRRIEALKK